MAKSRARGKKKSAADADSKSPLADAVVRLKKTQRAFLAAYAKCGNLTQAAAASKVPRTNHYFWLEVSADYRFVFAAAEEEAVDYLEVEARRRAVEGVRRLKFHQGEPIMVPALDASGNEVKDESGKTVLTPYIEHEYSDTLLIFLLKAKRPEQFRERHDFRMSGSVDHSMTVTHVDGLGFSLETRKRMLEEMRGKPAADSSSHKGPPASTNGHSKPNGKPGVNGNGHA